MHAKFLKIADLDFMHAKVAYHIYWQKNFGMKQDFHCWISCGDITLLILEQL